MRGSIQKRGKHSWRLIFDLERDHTGKRCQKTVTVRGSKKDAEAELSRILADIQHGGFVDPGKVTVREYLQKWLVHVATKTSAKTHERYSEIVELGIVPRLGSIRLAKLSPMQIQGFYAEALASGLKRRGGGGLSPRTVLHYHRVFSGALKQAVKWQLLSRNPADAVEPPRPVQKDMIVLDGDQTGTLLNAVEGSHLYIPVMLAITTGMRRGEVLALRWSDVDLEHSRLSVTQTLEKSRKGGLIFKQPKTKRSRRNITLPSITVDALRKRYAEQAEIFLRLGFGRRDDALVCCKPDGSPISPGALSSAFTKLVRRLDIPNVTFHGLRHTHATQLLKEGVHPKVAQERLGHSTISTTLDLYSHVMPGMQEDAALRVDKALKAALGKHTDVRK